MEIDKRRINSIRSVKDKILFIEINYAKHLKDHYDSILFVISTLEKVREIDISEAYGIEGLGIVEGLIEVGSLELRLEDGERWVYPILI